MESIGQRIKRLREARSLSQEQVASKVGVSRVAVTKWENGQTANLKLDNLLNLCTLFELTADELVTGEKHTRRIAPSLAPQNTPHQQAILNLFDGLTKEQQEEIYRELQETKQQNDAALMLARELQKKRA